MSDYTKTTEKFVGYPTTEVPTESTKFTKLISLGEAMTIEVDEFNGGENVEEDIRFSKEECEQIEKIFVGDSKDVEPMKLEEFEQIIGEGYEDVELRKMLENFKKRVKNLDPDLIEKISNTDDKNNEFNKIITDYLDEVFFMKFNIIEISVFQKRLRYVCRDLTRTSKRTRGKSSHKDDYCNPIKTEPTTKVPTESRELKKDLSSSEEGKEGVTDGREIVEENIRFSKEEIEQINKIFVKEDGTNVELTKIEEGVKNLDPDLREKISNTDYKNNEFKKIIASGLDAYFARFPNNNFSHTIETLNSPLNSLIRRKLIERCKKQTQYVKID